MDLRNAGRIFVNTPVVCGTKLVTGTNFAGASAIEQCEGSLVVQHTVNQGSEIRLSYNTVPAYKINVLRGLYREGSLHTLDNNQYIVTNYGESTDTRTVGQYGVVTKYTVEIVLLAYSYLKAQTSVRLAFPTSGTPFISVHDIAAKAGVRYNGFDFQIPVTRDSADTFFNFALRNEIETRAFEHQHFVFYGSGVVQTKPLQVSPIVTGVVSPVQISGSPPVQYRNARIEWANNTLDPFRNDPVYMKPTPQVIYLLEGDLDVTKPPDNITVFRDQKGSIISSVGLNNPVSPKTTPLDEQYGTWYQATRALYMVFDNGGQTKELRITKKVDGVTEYVESYRYGFMFTAYKLAATGGSPAQYWLPIEYKKTVYKYDKTNRRFDKVQYQDRQGIWRDTVVSPELEKLLKQSNVGYLVSTTTTGYKYLRFQTESQGGWDITKDTSIAGSVFWGKRVSGGIDGGSGGNTTAQLNYCQDMLQLYLYRRIPINGKTQYHLVESESIYNDTYINTNKEVNASIEKVPWAALPEQLRVVTTPDSEGYVGIARPDPDSYKEYLVVSERTEEIALAWRTNPLAKLYDPTTQTVGDKQPSVKANSIPTTYLPSLEPYVIGENTVTTIERRVIPNRNTTTKYTEVLEQNNRYKVPSGSEFNIPRVFTSVVDSTNSSNRIDKYVEYTTTNTAKGIQFDERAAITTFAEMEGRPPLATVQRTSVLQSDFQPDPFYKRDKDYYYTSIIDSDFPTDDTSTSFSMLEIKQSDLQGTKRALDFKLALENATNTQELTVDIGYYRPEYKVGSLTTIAEYDGQWLIRRVEHGFDFSGAFVANKPTRLTLGYWHTIQSQITTSQNTVQPPNRLPYNPSKYKVLGGAYPLEFNKLPNTPSLYGTRGTEETTLPDIEY